MRRNRRRVDWPQVFVHAGILHVLRLLGGPAGAGRCRLEGFYRRFWVQDAVKLALCDLLANNVDIVWEIDLLQRLHRKAGEDANDWRDEIACPKRGLGIDLWSRLVKLPRSSDGCIHAGPEEDEQVTDDDNQEHQPVPTIGVDQDVEVDRDHRRMGDVATETKPIRHIQAVEGNERAVDDGEIWDEENHDGLIDAIQHVKPE